MSYAHARLGPALRNRLCSIENRSVLGYPQQAPDPEESRRSSWDVEVGSVTDNWTSVRINVSGPDAAEEAQPVDDVLDSVIQLSAPINRVCHSYIDRPEKFPKKTLDDSRTIWQPPKSSSAKRSHGLLLSE